MTDGITLDQLDRLVGLKVMGWNHGWVHKWTPTRNPAQAASVLQHVVERLQAQDESLINLVTIQGMDASAIDANCQETGRGWSVTFWVSSQKVGFGRDHESLSVAICLAALFCLGLDDHGQAMHVELAP